MNHLKRQFGIPLHGYTVISLTEHMVVRSLSLTVNVARKIPAHGYSPILRIKFCKWIPWSKVLNIFNACQSAPTSEWTLPTNVITKTHMFLYCFFNDIFLGVLNPVFYGYQQYPNFEIYLSLILCFFVKYTSSVLYGHFFLFIYGVLLYYMCSHIFISPFLLIFNFWCISSKQKTLKLFIHFYVI